MQRMKRFMSGNWTRYNVLYILNTVQYANKSQTYILYTDRIRSSRDRLDFYAAIQIIFGTLHAILVPSSCYSFTRFAVCPIILQERSIISVILELYSAHMLSCNKKDCNILVLYTTSLGKIIGVSRDSFLV